VATLRVAVAKLAQSDVQRVRDNHDVADFISAFVAKPSACHAFN
jgi:hypothetical protein